MLLLSLSFFCSLFDVGDGTLSTNPKTQELMAIVSAQVLAHGEATPPKGILLQDDWRLQIDSELKQMLTNLICNKKRKLRPTWYVMF